MTSPNKGIRFFEDGEPMEGPDFVQRVKQIMRQACDEQGIDRQDMADVVSQLIDSEECRDTFFDWTNIEAVIFDHTGE